MNNSMNVDLDLYNLGLEYDKIKKQRDNLLRALREINTCLPSGNIKRLAQNERKSRNLISDIENIVQRAMNEVNNDS